MSTTQEPTFSPDLAAALDVAFVPGAQFTTEQKRAWQELKNKLRAEAYAEATAALHTHKHWFENEPHAMTGFMAAYNAMAQTTKDVTK